MRRIAKTEPVVYLILIAFCTPLFSWAGGKSAPKTPSSRQAQAQSSAHSNSSEEQERTPASQPQPSESHRMSPESLKLMNEMKEDLENSLKEGRKSL